MKIKLDSGAFMPEYAHEQDAGMDLRSSVNAVVLPQDSKNGCAVMPGSEVLVMEMKSLRPITREQVEKMRGEWKIYLNGNYNDEIYYCDVCGCDLDALARSNSFCSVCGSPMTDKAVDILWKRLEVMQNASD